MTDIRSLVHVNVHYLINQCICFCLFVFFSNN